MRSVRVGEMEIAYEERGSGPPLVLVHGFLSDHRDWRPQLDALAADFRVIAWDAPGCGESPDPPETWRAAEYADCLAEFFDAIELEAAHVCGLSWGGILAQEFYGPHAARVRSLVLADAYAGWGPSLGTPASDERLALCLRLSAKEPAELVSALAGGMVTPGAPKQVVDELSTIMASFHPVGFRAMSLACAEADTRWVWPRIEVPTLLIWGEADERSPLFVAEEFRRGIPGSRLVVIPGGHVSNMESPAEFNAAVREFLRGIDATDSAS